MIERENVTVTECPRRIIDTQQVSITDEDTGAESFYQIECHMPEGDDGSNWEYIAFEVLPDGDMVDLDEDTARWLHSIAWQKENIAPDEGQMEFWEE